MAAAMRSRRVLWPDDVKFGAACPGGEEVEKMVWKLKEEEGLTNKYPELWGKLNRYHIKSKQSPQKKPRFLLGYSGEEKASLWFESIGGFGDAGLLNSRGQIEREQI